MTGACWENGVAMGPVWGMALGQKGLKKTDARVSHRGRVWATASELRNCTRGRGRNDVPGPIAVGHVAGFARRRLARRLYERASFPISIRNQKISGTENTRTP